MEKVSVIIPCFNVEKYIAECLSSVTRQTYTHVQIICVNDGSTDRTGEIILHYQKKDSRIQLINQKNAGISASRNTGIAHADGSYFLFLDSDDWLEGDAIEIMICAMAGVDIVCCPYYRNFARLESKKNLGIEGIFDAQYIQRRLIGLIDDELVHLASFDSLVTCWAKLYRAETILGHHFQNEKLFGTWEDGIFNIEVLEQAKKVNIIRPALYHYRKIPSSATSSHKQELPEKWVKKFAWIRNYLQQRNKHPDFLKALNNRICITAVNLGFNEMNNPTTLYRKRNRIKNILQGEIYIRAFTDFRLGSLPYIWRPVYWAAKRKNSTVFTVFIWIIHRYINRGNR